jgi:diguanylate cyclase (GGDEF)-like protein
MKTSSLKRLLIFSLFAVIITGIFFFYNNTVSKILRQHSIHYTLELTARSAELLHVTLNEKLKFVSHTAAMLNGKSTTTEIIPLLQDFYTASNTRLAVIDENGVGLTNRNDPISIDNTTILQEINLHSKGITNPYDDPVTGCRTILLYDTYHDAADTAHKVYSSLSIDDLYDFFKLPLFKEEAFSYIVDQQGNMILRSSQPDDNNAFNSIFDIISNNPEASGQRENLMTALHSGNSGYGFFTHNGQNLLFACVPIPDTADWYAVTVVPEEIMLIPAKSIFLHTIGLSLIILIVLMLVVFMLTRSNDQLRQEKLQLATIDSVTNNINFSRFHEEVYQLLLNTSCKTLSVITLDAKDFKLFNEANGFHKGDQLLRSISKSIRDCIPYFPLHARITGDLFILLSFTQDRDILERCLQKISKNSTTTASSSLKFYAGVYCLQKGDEHLEFNLLLDRATLAKNKAKNTNKPGLVFYKESMHQQEIENHLMEQTMEKSLEDHNFVVYLQPKFSTKDKTCTGAEALVRWKHPEKGLISPDKFIPLFERNGFIIRLDQYVYTSCCKLLARWIASGIKPYHISINVSKAQIYLPNFAKHYTDIKNHYHIPDNVIELEFTETIFFEDIPYLSSLIGRLQDNGFLCSIDDFGKGYSSFSSIKDLPFDILKIDGEFFSKGCQQKRERLIVSCIVDMAHALSMKTVAEGIETREEVDYLTSINCDLIQGYIYSKPIPIEEFEKKYI